MPTPLTYPGVYIEEMPSGVRTLTGVSTSIAAFVGRTWRGTAGEPVAIFSYADFELEFGGLWRGSSVSYAVQQFFLSKTIPLRRKFGAARKDSRDAHLPNGRSHGFQSKRKRFQQLRSCKHAPDVVARLKNRDGLIDDVILVSVQVFAPALLDQLDHPSRIEIDTEADSAADLREVFDAEAETART